ncbi:hypothetical protein A7A08_02026 [Methyloligella halotolerans]|uniref:Uncharacterized protein n=1 Tax=Methyloligella halotolerans TaxID=1177755 RepID=A0A1E2RYZ8_9HYPH|nr:hypothetical protein [Methyloligella halotolerans]ODA67279.1 hypothetical protein A7A08_02026 [Methyloligella halotolerans]
MPQLIFLLVTGAGMILAGRLLRGASGRVADDLREVREAMNRKEQSRDRTTATPLERDPATGIYRPKRPDVS